MTITLGIPYEDRDLTLQAGAHTRHVTGGDADLDIPPIPGPDLVDRVARLMDPTELQRFKGRCVRRIEAADAGDFRPHRVAHSNGLAVAADNVSWLGRLFGR